MNFPRKLTGLILSLWLLMPTVAQPNPALRKGFHVACAGLGTYFATWPACTVYRGYNKVPMETMETLEDFHEGASEFCREQLKVAGVKDPKKINIKIFWPKRPFIACTAPNNTLLLSPNTARAARHAQLQNQFPKMIDLSHPLVTLIKVDELKGILQHEGTHLKNRDSETGLAYLYGTGVLASAHAVKKTTKELKKFSRYPLWKSALKIPSGFVKAATILAGGICLIRHQEQRADEGIANDLPILRAHAQQSRDNCRLNNLNVLLKGHEEFAAKHPSINYFLNDPMHPSPPSTR